MYSNILSMDFYHSYVLFIHLNYIYIRIVPKTMPKQLAEFEIINIRWPKLQPDVMLNKN